MTILGINHFTVLTRNVEQSCLFYESIIDAKRGPRPDFNFAGAWLYVDGEPLIHLVQIDEQPSGTPIIDHVALSARDLRRYLTKFKSNDIAFELKRLPEGCRESGSWQLFFHDPGGALLELCFPANELP